MLLLVVVLFFCCSVNSEELIRVNLVRQKSGLERLLERNTHPHHLKKIFGLKNTLYNEFYQKPHSNDSIKLYKYFQSQYYGEVLIGHPGQKFKMVFDTTYVHTWVTSVLCSPFAYPPCALRNKYDSSKSSTYMPVGTKFSFNTNLGNLSGFISKDKFHIGSLNVMNLTFAEIDEMSLVQLLYFEYDGIIGMGFDDNINDKVFPFSLVLFSQYPLMKRIFSFYINRDESTNKGGSLFIGGSDPKHYNGSFTYMATNDIQHWRTVMDRGSLHYVLPYTNKTVQFCTSGCQTYFMTGEPVIYGPEKDIKTINRFLSAHYIPYLNRYEVSCSNINKFPKITFTFVGKDFPIKGPDYVQKVMYGPVAMCLSAFATSTGIPSDSWALGIPFLGKYYVEFNMEKHVIGLADINV